MRWMLGQGLCVLATALLGGEAFANEIYVTTTVDKVSSTGGCSLKEAIWAANQDASEADPTGTGFIVTECNPGHGADIIVLQPGETYQIDDPAVDFGNSMGATATPMIRTDITIQGNGARLEPSSGAPQMRAFAVGAVNELRLHDLYIRGFVVVGGSGAGGGGGGLGAGGAIFVDGNALLEVTNCTFEGNGAIGGDGSSNPVTLPLDASAGGGGGGMGGHGGPGGDNGLNAVFCGGGGGGGPRGHGGFGWCDTDLFDGNATGGGGGGGGTVRSGSSADGFSSARGGDRGGGDGGFDPVNGSENGEDGEFSGGGGGGQSKESSTSSLHGGNGGRGWSASGGGGGGYDRGNGGEGGFGGGGGGGAIFLGLTGIAAGGDGGDGGFGAGGGAGPGNGVSPGPGRGGPVDEIVHLGGNGSERSGGGGAALGGAIFAVNASVFVTNSTFVGNFVSRGEGRGDAENGTDGGGAIFALDGALKLVHCTISDNQTTGAGGGVVVFGRAAGGALLELRNTLIANSVPLSRECFYQGNVTALGSGNLIEENFGCPGAFNADPQLEPLALNPPGLTPTMALPLTSPAVDAADDVWGLATDQRGAARPTNDGFDIGAFEAPERAADLEIVKSRSSATALPGDTITFTLDVSNLGPQDATNVQVVDDLPSTLTFYSCSTASTTPCGGTGNHVTVTYATLANGASDTVIITATVNFDVADQTVATNSASIAADAPNDPHPENNSASASITVNNRSDLLVTQSVSKPPTKLLVYTVKVKNLGPYEARQIVLNDPIPAGTRFLSVSGGPWTCVPLPSGSVGTLSCTLSSLAAGATATLTFTVKPVSPGSASVTNTATATLRTFDPNLANNISTLSTKVGSGK